MEENRTDPVEETPDDAAAVMPAKKKKRRVKKVLLIILISILALIAALVIAFFILKAIGKSHFKPAVIGVDSIGSVNNALVYDEGKTVSYNGKKYRYNEDVIYLAFMGVDKKSLDPVEGVEHSVGQSDTNMIVAIDTESGKTSLIIIPRDSMVDINVLDAEGKIVGYSEMQLCLSYAYGDGREKSCENVLESMKRLLCGIEIDNYYSLDLDGIGTLNDAVGGVQVTCLETITDVCTQGEVKTLWGDQARRYVQYRDTSTFNSDSVRRKRQIQFVKAFVAKAFSEIKEDFSTVSDLYSIAGDYSCTNFEISRVTYLASVLVDKYDAFTINDEDIYVLSGEASMGKTFMEVRLDETNVFETILKVFYVEQDK